MFSIIELLINGTHFLNVESTALPLIVSSHVSGTGTETGNK